MQINNIHVEQEIAFTNTAQFLIDINVLEVLTRNGKKNSQQQCIVLAGANPTKDDWKQGVSQVADRLIHFKTMQDNINWMVEIGDMVITGADENGRPRFALKEQVQ